MTDRAHFADFALDDQGRPIAGVSVEVRTPGTTTPIADTLYAADDPSGSTLTNPFIAGSDGLIEFYTTNPLRVDLYITKTGYQSKTIRRDLLRITQTSPTVQDEGSDLTARPKINFKGTTVAATDDAGNTRTNVTLPDYATPAIVLGTAAAAGSSPGVIRPDATIVAFDGTAPVTQAFGDAADPGNVAVAARRNHKHGMPSAPSAAEYDVLDLATNVAIVNTSAETTLYSFSVPGNTLGTNKCLVLTILYDYLNNTGGARTFTLRVKYGATTLFDDLTGTFAQSVNVRSGVLRLRLAGNGATNDQYLAGQITQGSQAAPTAGRGKLSNTDDLAATFGGDSAEDSTAAKTLTVTIQHSFASASLSCTLRHAELAVVG